MREVALLYPPVEKGGAKVAWFCIEEGVVRQGEAMLYGDAVPACVGEMDGQHAFKPLRRRRQIQMEAEEWQQPADGAEEPEAGVLDPESLDTELHQE